MHNTKNVAGQGRMQGSTKESMYIKVETIKHSNTWLEHQNNFQKAKHKLNWDNWEALQFTFRQNKQGTAHTSIKEHIKKETKTLHATPSEGKQTANTHTQ